MQNQVNLTDRTVLLSLGILAFLGNLGGVLALQSTPHTYKPESLALWHQEMLADPAGTIASSALFAVGVVSLGLFAFSLVWIRRNDNPSLLFCVGALFIGAGGLLNAAGSMAPLAALLFVPSDATGAVFGLLGLGLCLDAAFNLFLGLGLLCMGFTQSSGWPRWLRILSILAGAASCPVALQPFSDFYASLLIISGPLWLAWLIASSFWAKQHT